MGIHRNTGAPWDYSSVYDILRNPKYTGSIVFNRKSTKFRSKSRVNPREEWVVQPNSFQALVSADLFSLAQQRFSQTHREEKLLEDLRGLLQARKRLTGKIIEQAPQVASAATYHRHFKGLRNAYKLIGYERPTNVERVTKDRTRKSRFRIIRQRTMAALLKEFVRRSIPVETYPEGILLVGYGQMEVHIARSINPGLRGSRWDVVCPNARSKIFLAIRMQFNNIDVGDYLLFRDLPAPRHSRLYLHESEIPNIALSFTDVTSLIAELVPSEK